MQIANYCLGDEHKILELFELVFKQKMSLDYWRWRFLNNPAGSKMIKLMWEEDKLIGHYAVSPLSMNINNQLIFTAHSMTTMTHPDYGGKGIFKLLSLALYDEIENNLGCKAVWGFPNNNSHYGFINSLQWENITIIHTMGISPQKLVVSNNKLEVTEFELFDNEKANFIQSKINKFSVSIHRSKEYLNWRYCENPSVNYKKFYFNQKNERAVIITKIYPTTNDDVFDLNIVEAHLENYELIHDYLDYIVKSYHCNFNRITMWKNIFDIDHLKLEKKGFAPTLPQTYLCSRSHHTIANEFNDYRNWYISMGDSDVY